jgi:6-phosphogluconolactonase
MDGHEGPSQAEIECTDATLSKQEKGWTMRRFRIGRTTSRVLISTALSFILASAASLAQDLTVLFGTHTSGAGKGFSASRFNSKTGILSQPEFLIEAPAPAYFVLAAGQTRLYACNSNGFVSAYAVANGGRSLTFLNKVPSEGGDPSYISLDKTGKYIFVANYQGGSIVAWALMPDGSIGRRTAFVQHTGTGVDPKRQAHAYAHSIIVDPTNRFVLTADLGLDKLFVYKFDVKTGALTPNDPPFASVSPGLGARHVVFHPNGKWVYLDNEMGSKVVFFRWDSAKGSLEQMQMVSMLPEDFRGTSAAAEMKVSIDGRFLYGTNRYEGKGQNGDIVVFAIDQRSGLLKTIQHISSGGETPRNFEIDPSGRWMVVANHGSNNAVVFKVDGKRGLLTQQGAAVDVPYPFSPRFVTIGKVSR